MDPSQALAPAQGASGPGTLDWVNLALAILGIILTVVGFVIAIKQINKTRSAAEAATTAATVGTARIRYNQLIVIVPQMQNLEPEMDSAVRQDDVYAAERVLVRWRQLGTQALGILRDMGDGNHALAEAIDKACSAAISAKGRLGDVSPEKPLAALVSGVRKEVAAVNDKMGALLGALATQTGELEVGSPHA